ncbi:Alpha-L-fucosidase [Bertholletia excelsa]
MGLPGFVAAIILASVAMAVGVVDVLGLPPCDFPAIYNFGDSNSDTGGITAAFEPAPAPYGEHYFGKPAGRASDGRLIIDFIAERLKFPFLSAYLNSIGSNYQHGANFATGGSTILRPNETIYENGISPFYLGMQVTQFTQFKARSSELYSQATAADRAQLPNPDDFSKALYTLDIGQNDLSMSFRSMSDDHLRAEIPDMVNKFASSIPDMISQFAAAVKQLYEEGARAYWIHNTGPIGCLPVNTIKVQNPKTGYLDEQGCVKSQNEVAKEFNRQLKDRVTRLRKELPQASVTYVDIYAAKYGLISSAKKQGFEDPFKICCGHHENGIDIWCGKRANVNGTEIYSGSCENPSKVISWDGVHYSDAANFWIANQILDGSFADPPIPITHSYYKQV